MKYCIDWYGKDNDLLKSIDEINIDISKVRDLDDLKAFCEKHNTQNINLCLNNYQEAIDKKLITFILNFIKKYNKDFKLKIRLPYYEKEIIDGIKKDYPECKFFFKYIITNWEDLYFYNQLQVSDVYIAEELGFELDKVKNVLQTNKIKIRVFPNVAQAKWENFPELKKFWIRPEDIYLYEKYVDVCEFYGDPKNYELYYKIYKKGKWAGPIGEIIIDLHLEEFYNPNLLPYFSEKRLRCGRKCLKGGLCQSCDLLFEFSKNLEKNKLKLIYKKGENNGKN